ncbi:MAG TPA: EamA family transporter [Limnochordales bacterium]
MTAWDAAAKQGQWLVLLAAVLWGTTGTAQALAPAEASPVAIGAARLFIGGTALLAVAWRQGQVRAADWGRGPALAAAVAVALYQVCFFAGVAATGVATGTLVAIGSAPVFTGLVQWVAAAERPGRAWAAATVLAVAGCALLLGDGGQWQLNAPGIGLSLGAGAAFAVYTVASKRLLTAVPPSGTVALAFFGGALLLSPVVFWTEWAWLAEPRGALVALHLGLVATAGAYLLFGHGLARVPAPVATTLSLAEPLTAAVLGVVLLGERLSAVGWLGGGLILAGLGLLARGNGPVRRENAAPRMANSDARGQGFGQRR